MEINNGTDLVVDKTSCNSNIYLFLFIGLLLLIAALSVAGVVYYFKKVNSKKLDDKIYKTVYSNTGMLNY